MGDYYKSNAIYDALNVTTHNFQWVSGNSWLLVYGNKSNNEAKVLVLTHGKSWNEQSNIISTLKFLAKKLKIPIFKIVFDDSENTSITSIDFYSSLTSLKEIITLDKLKSKFKDIGLDIIDGTCDKYLNDKTSSAYHKWQRNSLGNKIIVSDLDLIRVNKDKEPIEFIELKRSTASVSTWKPYRDDFVNFNLIDHISQQTKIPLFIVYNRMIKDNSTKIISKDIHDPISIFSFTKNNYKSVEIDYSFEKFVSGDYLNKTNLTIAVTNTNQISNLLPICQSCNKPFTPRTQNAVLCIDCWKKQYVYS